MRPSEVEAPAPTIAEAELRLWLWQLGAADLFRHVEL
jgi:hypothetical protein